MASQEDPIIISDDEPVDETSSAEKADSTEKETPPKKKRAAKAAKKKRAAKSTPRKKKASKEVSESPAEEEQKPEEGENPAPDEVAEMVAEGEEKKDAEKVEARNEEEAKASEPAPEPDPGPPPPEFIDMNRFMEQTSAELYELGASLGLRVGGITSKHQLVFEILRHWGKRGTRIEVEGILEVGKEGFGFLRWPEFNFYPHEDNVYVSANFARKASLKKGNCVRGFARAPQDGDKHRKFLLLDEITHVEGVAFDKWEPPTAFDDLTALSPRERFVLERTDTISPRVIDLVAPIGKGQRGVIVAPPRGGKTILLKEVAMSIVTNHPKVEVIILLLDERPEEVTDFEESVPGAKVYSSTFDETPDRHIQVAELVTERAKRLVETGRDVVILLDSLTRLARGYNGLQRGRGRTMSGGIDQQALQKSRKLFNIARNAEENGSLTVLATALIDTGSRMDDVIFEEFKGSGNLEIELDRELLERRIFPAINLPKTGTRKDDLLYHPDEMRKVNHIRRQLAQLPGGEAIQILVRNIRETKSNTELLLKGLKI
ncbi:MAG: transcription termination factor Rho [Verrucomicrobiota bacterium]